MVSLGRNLMLMLLAVTAVASMASAQEVISRVGNANYNGGQSNPFRQTYYYAIRNQIVYSASELRQAANGALDNGGLLKEIRIRRTSGSFATMYGFRLRLANSSRGITSLSSSARQNYSGSLSEVIPRRNFSPSSMSRNSATYGRFQFNNDWDWNGSSNILLDFSWDRCNTYGFYVPSASGRYSRYYRQYNYNGYYYNNRMHTYDYLGYGDSSSNWDIEFVFEVKGVSVTANPGNYEQEYAHSQGANDDGIEAGSFELASGNITGASLEEIEIEETGSADAQAAISEVGIFRDNGNSSYDGSDTQIGNWTQFNGANGTASFTVQSGQQQFGSNDDREYWIVVKLSGTGVPPNQLDFIVSDLTVAQDTIAIGAPTPTADTIQGIQLLVPDLNAVDTSPSTAILGEMDSDNNVLHGFSLAYPAGPENTIGSVTLQAFGSGDDAASVSRVTLWRDENQNGVADPGTDIELGTATFNGNDGSATINAGQSGNMIDEGETHEYLVTANFNTVGNHGQTFRSQITQIDGVLPGTNVTGIPTPSGGYSAGIILQNPLAVTWHGPLNARGTDSSARGELVADFEITAQVMSWEVENIQFEASGSLNDAVGFHQIHLYEDTNNNGEYDTDGADDLAGPSGVAFGQDNGLYVARLDDPAFAARQTRRFFMVVDFSGIANASETFLVRVRDVIGTPAQGGGDATNVPTANAGQITIGGANLSLMVNGPSAAKTVSNTSLGETGQGEVMLDFTLRSSNSNRQVGELVFKADGSGNDATAFQNVTLYEDFNRNGEFDGTPIDRVAATNSVEAFDADNGLYTATMADMDVLAGAERRFFLVAQLNGTALASETFNVRVQSMQASAGFTSGVPTTTSNALVIDTPVLTVANAPDAPTNTGLRKAAAFSHVIGRYRFTASNANITVSRLQLSQLGTADWTTMLDANNGLELWLDDGNGIVDGPGVDTLLYQGTPDASVQDIVLASPVTVDNASSVDLFVRLNVNQTAGGSTPDTFTIAIGSPEAVTTTGSEMVMIGTPAPRSSTLSVVEFYVTGFSPLAVPALTAGQEIEMTGSGFTAPISVSIGGIPCGGITSVSPDGTSVTGMTVPYGPTGSHDIVVQTSVLGEITLPMQFTYGSTGGDGSSAGVCSLNSGSTGSWAVLMLFGTGGLLLLLRKRQMA